MSAELVEQELESVALTWPEKARGLRISSQETYERACEMLLGIKALRKEIDGVHDPAISAAHASHVAALAAKKKSAGPLDQAEAIIKPAIAVWLTNQERIRLEADRKAREEAARLEEEMRLATAVQAEELGAEPETVAEILETPIPMPMTVAPKTYAPVSGVSTRENWSAQVVDLRQLCKAIAEGRASVAFVKPDMVSLNAQARSLKSTLSIPGVRAVKETGIAARAR